VTSAEAETSATPLERLLVRLTDLDARLREWQRSVDRELAAVLRERKLRRLFKKPSPEEIRDSVEEARRRAGIGILVELATLLDELCDLYATSLPQDRAKIRARVGSAETVFELYWGYVEAQPTRIRGPGDEPALLRGLVAVAIDDMRTDVEHVDAVLGDLLVAAERAGIPWRSVLDGAANVANRGAGGGGACMQAYLLEFTSSMYFRTSVSERMREARREGRATSP
jgi:ribosomal protein S21